jgi:nucleotide-binding universal stress UspA family protein
MFKRILVPTDGSALSASAVDHAFAFAHEIGAELVVMTVTEPFHVFALSGDHPEDTPASFQHEVHRRAGLLLSDAQNKADARGLRCSTMQAENEHPHQAIIEAAEDTGCDLIIMASHGRRGVTALLLGSVTVKVLTHSKLPVLVYR